MKKKIGLFLIIFLFGALSQVYGHSTKGRLKIDLKKDKPGINDFAYFTEPYVTRKLFIDKYKKTKMRFFVKSFDKLDLIKNSAHLEITVLDISNNETFPYKLFFTRDESEQWNLQKNNNEKIPVFTYVKKWPYYYRVYIIPFAELGLVAALIFLVYIRIKQRDKGKMENKIITLLLFFTVFLLCGNLYAHTPILRCDETDNTCICSGIFSDMSIPSKAKLIVIDLNYKIILKTELDEFGEKIFKIPNQPYGVIMNAGAGHVTPPWVPERYADLKFVCKKKFFKKNFNFFALFSVVVIALLIALKFFLPYKQRPD